MAPGHAVVSFLEAMQATVESSMRFLVCGTKDLDIKGVPSL
jgi:hypothetical protein